MTEAEGNMSCSATPQVVRKADAGVVMGANGSFETGFFHIEHLDKDGNLLYECTVNNGTTKEFAQNIWNVSRPAADITAGDATNQLGAAGRLTKVGLFKYSSGGTAGLPALATSDVYSGISGSTNTFSGGAGGSSRVFALAYTAATWLASSDTPGTADACTLANATDVGFTGSAHTNVAGAYVYVCDSTDTGTANKGCLLATANFSALIASVAAADTINVTFTGTLTVS